MPYPSEHAARLVDPAKFAQFRRENDKFGPGVHAIFGITEAGKSELQAIRFDAAAFSLDHVRRWLAKSRLSAAHGGAGDQDGGKRLRSLLDRRRRNQRWSP